MKKFAISVPTPVMALVDKAAKKRRITRSGFISQVLRICAQAEADEEMSRKIDAFFSDPGIAAEQKKAADDFLALSGW